GRDTACLVASRQGSYGSAHGPDPRALPSLAHRWPTHHFRTPRLACQRRGRRSATPVSPAKPNAAADGSGTYVGEKLSKTAVPTLRLKVAWRMPTCGGRPARSGRVTLSVGTSTVTLASAAAVNVKTFPLRSSFRKGRRLPIPDRTGELPLSVLRNAITSPLR